jgi:DNA-binding NarL/FixJ family response regulator
MLGALAAASNDIEYWVPEGDFFARFDAIARKHLGDESYNREWDTGHRLPRAQLITEIEHLLETSTATSISPITVAPEANPLTTRELEVLRLIVAGHTNQEIADQLFIGLRTVTTHVTNILTKLGVENRAAAVAYAFQHRFLLPDSNPE